MTGGAMRAMAMLGLAASLLAGSPLVCGVPAGAAEPRPVLGDVSPPSPLARPYDEAADAHAELDRALARAKAAERRVLVDFGGNWCPDCRVLGGVLALAPVRRFVDDRYEVVAIDVGRFSKNLDIPRWFGIELKGVPTVLVLDGDGRLLNGGHTLDLGDAREMTPQAIVDWLARWSAIPGS
jgi:thiol-disulfide isomerase/thioredoxin